MELTQEEIKRIMAMYLGCEVEPNSRVEHFKYILESILSGGKAYHLLISGSQVTTVKYANEFKLLLRSLEAITDEEAIEVARIVGYSESNKRRMVNYGKSNIHSLMNNEIWQYLVSPGLGKIPFAVPLWYGINHPLNGKNAVEAGLAEYVKSDTSITKQTTL